MLETENLVRKYAHIYSFRKYTFQSAKYLLILLMSALIFAKKKSVFLGRNGTFTKRNSGTAVS